MNIKDELNWNLKQFEAIKKQIKKGERKKNQSLSNFRRLSDR